MNIINSPECHLKWIDPVPIWFKMPRPLLPDHTSSSMLCKLGRPSTIPFKALHIIIVIVQ